MFGELGLSSRGLEVGEKGDTGGGREGGGGRRPPGAATTPTPTRGARWRSRSTPQATRCPPRRSVLRRGGPRGAFDLLRVAVAPATSVLVGERGDEGRSRSVRVVAEARVANPSVRTAARSPRGRRPRGMALGRLNRGALECAHGGAGAHRRIVRPRVAWVWHPAGPRGAVADTRAQRRALEGSRRDRPLPSTRMGSRLVRLQCDGPGSGAYSTMPFSWRYSAATSSGSSCSMSTWALSLRMVSASRVSETEFRTSSIFGFCSRTSLLTTGAG